MRRILLFFILLLSIKSIYSQNTFDFYINPKLHIEDSLKIPILDKYHPALYSSLSASERDSFQILMDERRLLYSGDSVTVTEHFALWHPYIMRLNYEDPHYRVFPLLVITNKKYKENDIKVVPVNVLLINDTVVVSKSLDEKILEGDRILSINNVPIEAMLKYYYNDRYVPLLLLQQYFHFAFSPHYEVEIERQGKRMVVETSGMGYTDASLYLTHGDWKTKIYDEHKTGYMLLNKFYPNNSVLIKKLSGFIKSVQKKGYENIIIDIRENTGGSGHNFDELISIFTDMPSFPYLKEKCVRVSEYVVNDYKLTPNMLDSLYHLPESEFYTQVPTKPKRYLGEMNYYILVSRNTGSMAASFANILQYNNLAQLAGEPLQHNALKYGEIIPLAWGSRSNIEVFSTVCMDEYTVREDGQVYPDIYIPFVAEEFMNGGDPIIEKLLDIIKKKQDE